MSKTPSGNSGGAKANKVLGKPTGTAPKTPFVPGKTDKLPGKFKVGNPILGQQRVPVKASVKPEKKAGQQAVNAVKIVKADRMNTTMKKMGF